VFKTHKPKSVPGLLDFVTKIVDMGLENLIVYSKSTIHPINEQQLSKQNSDKWWFLN
jgi:hypothetical protein